MKHERKIIVNESALDNKDASSVFLWCMHCWRTYRRGECRLVKGFQLCPYEDCDGDTVLDAVPWGSMRSAWPGFPVIPVRGQKYTDMRGDDCRSGAVDETHLEYFMEKIRTAKPGEVEFFGP